MCETAALKLCETVDCVRQGFAHRQLLLDFYERYVLLDYSVMERHKSYGRPRVPRLVVSLLCSNQRSCALCARSIAPEDLSPDVLLLVVNELIARVWVLVSDPPVAAALPPKGARALAAAAPSRGGARLLYGQFTKDSQIQVGKSMVFMRNELVIALEALRDQKLTTMDVAVVAMQKVFRGFMSHKKYLLARYAIIKVRWQRILSPTRCVACPCQRPAPQHGGSTTSGAWSYQLCFSGHHAPFPVIYVD